MLEISQTSIYLNNLNSTLHYQILKSAEGKASPIEIMSALANAYGGLLIDLLGKKAAESLLRGHADHIAAREDNGISINNN